VFHLISVMIAVPFNDDHSVMVVMSVAIPIVMAMLSVVISIVVVVLHDDPAALGLRGCSKRHRQAKRRQRGKSISYLTHVFLLSPDGNHRRTR
jgi:hypothetical protein